MGEAMLMRVALALGPELLGYFKGKRESRKAAKWLSEIWDMIEHVEGQTASRNWKSSTVIASNRLPVKSRHLNSIIETFLAMQKGSPIGEMLSEKQGIEGTWSYREHHEHTTHYVTVMRTKG